MAFKYIEHEADMGILGIGSTIGEAFEEGAKAMFGIMADLEKIEPKEEITVKCTAPGIEELFVEWLNALLAEKDIKEMLFSEFKVKIEKKNSSYILNGKARGEKLDQEKHQVKLEVKGATYSGLKFFERMEKGIKKYYIQCVVDV